MITLLFGYTGNGIRCVYDGYPNDGYRHNEDLASLQDKDKHCSLIKGILKTASTLGTGEFDVERTKFNIMGPTIT